MGAGVSGLHAASVATLDQVDVYERDTATMAMLYRVRCGPHCVATLALHREHGSPDTRTASVHVHPDAEPTSSWSMQAQRPEGAVDLAVRASTALHVAVEWEALMHAFALLRTALFRADESGALVCFREDPDRAELCHCGHCTWDRRRVAVKAREGRRRRVRRQRRHRAIAADKRSR